MKKYLWVFLAAVPACSLANENAMNLGESVIDVVKCETTKGEKIWVALNNLKTFTYMKNDVNVADQTIDNAYLQAVIQLVKGAELGQPFQFNNFRD